MNKAIEFLQKAEGEMKSCSCAEKRKNEGLSLQENLKSKEIDKNLERKLKESYEELVRNKKKGMEGASKKAEDNIKQIKDELEEKMEERGDNYNDFSDDVNRIFELHKEIAELELDL